MYAHVLILVLPVVLFFRKKTFIKTYNHFTFFKLHVSLNWKNVSASGHLYKQILKSAMMPCFMLDWNWLGGSWEDEHVKCKTITPRIMATETGHNFNKKSHPSAKMSK